jgi:hypothetical protein
MRKSIEFVGLGFLVALYYITWSALTGPQRLPDRIPTHFDISGTPNAWGPPSTLWLLPIVGTALYVLITLIAHFPATFNYPVRVTPLSLPRIQDETKNMVSWIKAEIACLFHLDPMDNHSIGAGQRAAHVCLDDSHFYDGCNRHRLLAPRYDHPHREVGQRFPGNRVIGGTRNSSATRGRTVASS